MRCDGNGTGKVPVSKEEQEQEEMALVILVGEQTLDGNPSRGGKRQWPSGCIPSHTGGEPNKPRKPKSRKKWKAVEAAKPNPTTTTPTPGSRLQCDEELSCQEKLEKLGAQQDSASLH